MLNETVQCEDYNYPMTSAEKFSKVTNWLLLLYLISKAIQYVISARGIAFEP